MERQEYRKERVAAVALLRRRAGLAEFSSERVREDCEVAHLARRIAVRTHCDHRPPDDPRPPGVQPWAGQPHGVFVRTRDGRELERWSSIVRVLDPDGMDWEAVIAKFQECAGFSRICPPEAAERVIAAVTGLAEAPNLWELTKACVLKPENRL